MGDKILGRENVADENIQSLNVIIGDSDEGYCKEVQTFLNESPEYKLMFSGRATTYIELESLVNEKKPEIILIDLCRRSCLFSWFRFCVR